jgi:hypothetical protein
MGPIGTNHQPITDPNRLVSGSVPGREHQLNRSVAQQIVSTSISVTRSPHAA